MTIQFMYEFRSLSDKFPTIFWNLIFHISLPSLSYISKKKKETLNFRIQTFDGERNQKNANLHKALNSI